MITGFRINSIDGFIESSTPAETMVELSKLKEGDVVLASYFDDGWSIGVLSRGDNGRLGFSLGLSYCDVSLADQVRLTTGTAVKSKKAVVFCIPGQVGSSGLIVSNLKDSFVDEDGDTVLEENAAMEALESFILAQFCAGIDVSTSEYGSALDTTLEALGNNL